VALLDLYLPILADMPLIKTTKQNRKGSRTDTKETAILAHA